MKSAIRKLPICTKKVPKSVLVVTNTTRIRQKMEGIRALGYKCTSIDAGGGVMHFLQRNDERINVIIVDLVAEIGAEKLIRWIRENRPGIYVVCILNTGSDFGPKAAALGAMVLDEGKIDEIPEVLRNLLSQQTRS